MPIDPPVPDGARPAARVLLLSPDGRVLLLHAQRPDGHRFWLAPGGGLEPGESFLEAARRELHEETGLDAMIGPCAWTRLHRYRWGGRERCQYERFFVAHTPRRHIKPAARDAYITGHRWWSPEAISASAHQFAPRRMAELLPDIVAGRYPATPIDCGM